MSELREEIPAEKKKLLEPFKLEEEKKKVEEKEEEEEEDSEEEESEEKKLDPKVKAQTEKEKKLEDAKRAKEKILEDKKQKEIADKKLLDQNKNDLQKFILQNAEDNLLAMQDIQHLYDDLLRLRSCDKPDHKQIAIYEKLMRGTQVQKAAMIDFTTDYVNEQDRNLGDQVLVFPNPDHPSYTKKYLRLKDCFMVLDTCFRFGTDKAGLAFKSNFTRAFLKVYMTLGRIKSDDKTAKPFSKFSEKGRLSNKVLEKYRDLELLPLVKRQLSQGGYHEPDPDNNVLWRKTTQPMYRLAEDGETEELIEQGDFMTLLRNSIFLKLGEQIGFQVRNFISSDQKMIMSVIFCNIKNMKNQSELISLKKQLEESSYDLFAYEPVDKDSRPLRMNKALSLTFEEEQGKELIGQYKGKAWEKLKIKILNLTEEIKFKKIGNETNIMLPGQDCNEVLDNEDVPYGMWRIYSQFLEHLKVRVDKIREELHAPFTDDEIKQSQFLIQEKKGKGQKKKKENRQIPLTEPHSKVILIMRSEKSRIDYLSAFKESMSKANWGVIGSSKLKNLHTRYGHPSTAVFSEYFTAKNNQHFLSKLKSEQIWKKYYVSETKRQSQFENVERLRTIEQLLNSCFNMTALKSMGLLIDNFCLHENYSLLGVKQERVFKEFDSYIKSQMDVKNEIEIKKIEMQEIMKQKKHRNRDIIVDKNKIQRQFEQWKTDNYLATIDRFAEIKIAASKDKNNKQMPSLNSAWKLSICRPFEIPVENIKNYFGEHIALFFLFATKLNTKLLILAIPMAALAFFEFLEQILGHNLGPFFIYMSLLGSSIYIMIWAVYVTESWRDNQVEFQRQFGLTEDLEDEERPQPSGSYVRSLTDDDMNELQIKSQKFLMGILWFLVLALVGGNGYLTYYIIDNTRLWWDGVSSQVDTSNIHNGGLITSYFGTYHIFGSAAICISQIIMGVIFSAFAKVIVGQSNPKSIRIYENAYIPRYLCIQLANDFVPFMLLCFLFPYLQVSSGNHTEALEKQFKEDRAQYFRSIITLRVIIANSRLIFAWIKNKLSNIIKTISNNRKLSINKKRTDSFLKKLPAIDSAYLRINTFISLQYNRREFNYTSDIDGVLLEYFTYVQNFSTIIFWSISMPLLPLIVFFFQMINQKVAKNNLFYILRRPSPKQSAHIGKWYTMMQIMSFLAIPINALIVQLSNTYQYFGKELIKENPDQAQLYAVQVFMCYMIFILVVNILVTSSYSKPVPLGTTFMNRSQYLAEKTCNSFKQTNNNFNLANCIPIYKVWGSNMERKTDVFDQSDCSTDFKPKQFYQQIDDYEKKKEEDELNRKEEERKKLENKSKKVEDEEQKNPL